MKIKTYETELAARLDTKEIEWLKQKNKVEQEVFAEFKKQIAGELKLYIKENKLGINETARKIRITFSQLDKILKGQANLTAHTLAKLAAAMDKKITLTWKNLKS